MKNLGGKKVTAKDIQSREIWGLCCVDHISSSLLLLTKCIAQTCLRNSKKIQERKIQLSGAGTDWPLIFHEAFYAQVPLQSKIQNENSKVYANGDLWSE